FFGKPVEESDEENPRPASWIEESPSNQFRDSLQGIVQNDFRQETGSIKHPGLFVRRLQKLLVDGADRFNRNASEVIGPERALPRSDDRSSEESIQRLDVAIENQGGFRVQIIAEQVSVKVFTQ